MELPASWTIEVLARLRTEDEMRVWLRDGLPDSALRYEGFDQVTLAESVEQVVRAAEEHRRSGGTPRTRSALAGCLQNYFAAMCEATVRRFAGAAPCLPFMR